MRAPCRAAARPIVRLQGRRAALLGLLAGVCMVGVSMVGSTVAAAPATPVGKASLYGGEASQWRLANGLNVILLPDPKATTVAIHTWVGAGSAQERPGATGAAHLLEHLMFKATETQPGGAFDRLLESFGASANAATWLEWTSFHEVVLPERVTEVLAMEADRLHRLRFEARSFAAELDVVRNERRETVDDDPDARLAEALYHLAYGGHPYGHPTIGWQQDLARISLDDVRRFHRRWYQPANVWLVIVGPIDAARLLPTIARLHGAIPAGAPRATKAAPGRLPTLGGKPRKVRIDAAADRVVVAWRTVPLAHPDHAPLTVLVEILANAASGRVTEALVHQGGLAAHVQAELPITREVGLLELAIELRPGVSAAQGLTALDALLRKRQPIRQGEVAAAHRRLSMQRYQTLASTDGRADSLGLLACVAGGLEGAVRREAALAAVKLADVQRVMDTWLKDSNRVVVLGEAEASRGVEARR